MENNVHYEKFKSMNEMLEIMENRGINSVFQKKDKLSSQNNEAEDKRKFSGVDTYSDAMELIKGGYSDPLNKLKKGMLKIAENNKYIRPRTKNDFVGFAPNVPNTLMNLPITMINREKVAKKDKNIHLTYSFCADAIFKPNQFVEAGINFVGLVNSLEKQGYRVKIDTIFFSCSSKEISGFTVTLKEYSQNLNLLKLSFPLVHPAMLRRISFKWLETTPEITDNDYINGYGFPLTAKFRFDGIKEKNWLKENGILKNENSYYCNVYQAYEAKSIEELAKIMEISK